MKKMFSSESCDIVFCSLCNKDRKLPEYLDDFNACIKCGGFGFVMKESRNSQQKQTSARSRKRVSVSH